MQRFVHALGALVVGALVVAGLTVGLTAPSQAAGARRLPCLDLQALTAPVISGTGAVGSQIDLTDMPSWNCDLGLVSTTVQWFNDAGAIAGQNAGSYTPGAGDAGQTVYAVVTGSVLGLVPVPVSSNGIDVPVPSDPGDPGDPGNPGDPGSTGDVLTLLNSIGIVGGDQVGQLVAVTDPVWSLPGVSTSYQWLRDGVTIPGADGQTYVLSPEDAGHAVSAQVTGALADLPVVTQVTDALNVPVGSSETQLSPAGDVSIDGSKKIGTDLGLTGPTWDPADATNEYQWLRDGAPIAGATDDTYTLTAADFEHSVAVAVTGHKDGYTDNTITSDPIAPVVGDAIRFTTKPRITGSGRIGKLLTADPGQWSGGTEGSGEPDYSYQWLRNGQEITGAVAQTYQVDRADAGRRISVLVTATRPAYQSGKFTTATVTAAKLGSKLVAKAHKTVRKGRAAVVRLVLRVRGVGSPTGRVKLLDGRKKVGKAAFAKGKHGRVVVKVRRLTPGVHKLRAVYAGTSAIAGARSKVVRLKVLKK